MSLITAIQNALFTVIATTESPVFADDDTQEVPVLTLHTRAIDLSEIHEVSQLMNALVDYQPFETDDVWTLGHIRETKIVGSDVHVLIEAVRNEEKHSIQPKWRNLSIHNVEYAWYE